MTRGPRNRSVEVERVVQSLVAFSEGGRTHGEIWAETQRDLNQVSLWLLGQPVD